MLLLRDLVTAPLVAAQERAVPVVPNRDGAAAVSDRLNIRAYPNIEAIVHGNISGRFSEWSRVQPEAKAILSELESLCAAYREAVEALGDIAGVGADEQPCWCYAGNRNVEHDAGCRSMRAVLAKARAALGEKEQPKDQDWGQVADDLYNVMRSPAKAQPKP